MKLTKLLTVFVGIAVLICMTATAGMSAEATWVTDFAKAKQTAAKEKKDLLVNFTGSDWCPYCIKLHDNVFSKKEFQEAIPKKFVMVTLDFPKDKSKQSKEEQQQNKKLQDQYSVSGFPTIYLMDADGKPFAKNVGYGGDSAADYVKDLLNKDQIRVKRDNLLTKAKSAQGVEKAKLIDQALSLMDNEIALAFYKDEYKEIIAADADNKAGLKSKYEGIVRAEDLKGKIQDIMSSAQGDQDAMKQAIPKLTALITDDSSDAEKFQVLFARANLKYQNQDKDGSKADLEECLKVSTDPAKTTQIKNILSRVFNQ